MRNQGADAEPVSGKRDVFEIVGAGDVDEYVRGMGREFEVGHQIGAAGDNLYLGGYGMLSQQSHGVA